MRARGALRERPHARTRALCERLHARTRCTPRAHARAHMAHSVRVDPTFVRSLTHLLRPISCLRFGFVVPNHKKGLQRQIGVGPLVSSQKRRAAVSPQINRLSTAGFVPPSVYIGFRLFVLPKSRSGHSSSIPWRSWREKGTVVPWAKRPVGDPSCLAPHCPAALPYAAFFIELFLSVYRTGYKFLNVRI